MQQYGRISLALAAILLAIGLQGCFFPPANAVRVATLSKPESKSMTRLVYGLDSSHGGLAVALALYDPATNREGNCSRFDHTEARSAALGTTYFVFDVPPGAYIVSRYETSGFMFSSDPAAFVVPEGQVTYVGDFFRSDVADLQPSELGSHEGSGPIRIRRNAMAAAKHSLDEQAADMALAEVLPGVQHALGFICSP